MPKALALGNGETLVCFDQFGQDRDLYFPYVGLENQCGGHLSHRIGVWVDGNLSWTNDGFWQVKIDTLHDTFAGKTVATNQGLGVELEIEDVVYNERNILLRQLKVRNLSDHSRLIKLFFAHEFELYESHTGDTGYFDPKTHALVHYKGRRVALINARAGDQEFDQFTVGVFGSKGKEGSFLDAIDGNLEKNAVEHGRVDSVIGFELTVAGTSDSQVDYWLALGRSIKEVTALNRYVVAKTPQHLRNTSKNFWKAWVNKQNFSFYGLDERTVRLFKESLFLIRSHVDNRGSILASGDSDMLHHGHDTYAYMWPRDGALIAVALDRAGYSSSAKQFFNFCNEVITNEGYFMHKYRPDRSLGSSWHPWIRDGKPELPIQEDETALVLIALWEHYSITKDVEFIEQLYNSLIMRAADFMVSFSYRETGLPYASYDLWEEKYGISTFTCSAVYGALMAAAKFAKLLGKNKSAALYESAALKMRDAIVKHLYDEDQGVFVKLLSMNGNSITYDRTLDISSFYGLYKFGVVEPNDPKLQRMLTAITKRLGALSRIGGFPRYEEDGYYRTASDAPPNPWFITTLWIAQYHLKNAKTPKEVEKAKEIISWVVDHALESGVLSEQLDPFTGEQLSAAPLTWSHAEFVVTIIDYLDKLEEMGVCKACNPVT